MSKSIYINTLGCAKNEVDSKKMADKLKNAGYLITQNHEEAELFIINTCSFIEMATTESIDTVLDFLDIKNDRGVSVVVSGCMPARYSVLLEQELPEVDAFLPCADEDNIVDVVSSLIGLPEPSDTKINEDLIISTYVKISEGCDRACSFCTIPKIRGRYHSFSYEQIFDDVSSAVNGGAKEINFVAQDTGHWGRDLLPQSSLADLLDKIATAFPDVYFRVLYVQPDEVTDDLLTTIKNHDNIINYLDIPFQHVSKHILNRMNRTGDFDDFKKRIKHIKSFLPDVTLRTTLMVGFPGETDENFQKLIDFVTLGLFDYIGIFKYSDEDLANSSGLDNKVDEQEATYRLNELTEVVDTISASKIREKIDTVQEVLVEGQEEDGQLFGRCFFQAPEVDGITFVDRGEIGEVVEVKITDSLMYDLEGEVM